jgi:hypothetical protein
MRGDVPPDVTVQSASAATDESVRDIPPSNKVPTRFPGRARTPTTRSLESNMPPRGSVGKHPAMESVDGGGRALTISAVSVRSTY